MMYRYNHLKARVAAIYTAALVCMIILACVDSAALFFFLNSVSAASLETLFDLMSKCPDAASYSKRPVLSLAN